MRKQNRNSQFVVEDLQSYPAKRGVHVVDFLSLFSRIDLDTQQGKA